MSTNNFDRRQFLQSALCSGLLYGAGSLPGFMSSAQAAPAPLNQRIIANLFFDGGVDFRHLIVPAYDPAPDSFGNKYWKHRWRAHRVSETNQATWQARFEDDYYPITVGGSGWNGGLVDVGGLNSGTTFGIWREAGWLIDMFRAGNVALVFNAVGGTNRAHDLSSLMLNQGNLLSSLNQQDRSGWGGRLARSAGGNSISLISSPTPFSFGPFGNSPNYNPNRIDNRELISIQNSREIGLFDFNFNDHQVNHRNQRRARTSKSYYAALRQETIPEVYEKFMDHESKVREFGNLIKARLESVPIPIYIQALMRGVNGPNGQPINPEPNPNSENFGDPRRVLRNSYSFGRQIQNFYDVVAANPELNPRVLSMRYGGWDSHNNQRVIPNVLASDPNTTESRGIESGFRDIFGGKFGSGQSSPNALHGGFSALWASLPNQSDRNNILLTMAGEFGRQIRDNGDAGTDHGKGNLMLVIGERCRGGVYGEMFPDSEVDKYDNTQLNTPDIDARTEIDHLFASVCNWVSPNSGQFVFPRTRSGYSGTAPIIERAGMFNALFT